MSVEVRYDADRVREQANGKWDLIIGHLAPIMRSAIAAGRKRDFCPKHGGKSGTAFAVFPPNSKKGSFAETGGCVCNTCGIFGNGFLTLQWVLDRPGPSGFVDVVNKVGEWLGMSPDQQAMPRPYQKPLPLKAGHSAEELAEVKAGIAKLASAWEHALEIDHQDAAVARAYFGFRGLSVPASLTDVRFSPAEKYYSPKPDTNDEFDCVGRYPALILKVRNYQGRTYKHQRIYMEPDGTRFQRGDRKKLTQAVADLNNEGLHIEVFPFPGGFLGLTEGFENAVAVRLGVGMTCWATYSSSVMPKFVPPERCRILFIWADKDPAGLKAAIALKERLADEKPNLKVTIFLPPEGMDWNDVYQKIGPVGFKSPAVWHPVAAAAAE